MRTDCTLRTLLSALGDLDGKEIPKKKKRGYMWTYNWFTLLYSRN